MSGSRLALGEEVVVRGKVLEQEQGMQLDLDPNDKQPPIPPQSVAIIEELPQRKKDWVSTSEAAEILKELGCPRWRSVFGYATFWSMFFPSHCLRVQTGTAQWEYRISTDLLYWFAELYKKRANEGVVSTWNRSKWLTIREAVEYAGLPQGVLTSAAGALFPFFPNDIVRARSGPTCFYLLSRRIVREIQQRKKLNSSICPVRGVGELPSTKGPSLIVLSSIQEVDFKYRLRAITLEISQEEKGVWLDESLASAFLREEAAFSKSKLADLRIAWSLFFPNFVRRSPEGEYSFSLAFLDNFVRRLKKRTEEGCELSGVPAGWYTCADLARMMDVDVSWVQGIVFALFPLLDADVAVYRLNDGLREYCASPELAVEIIRRYKENIKDGNCPPPLPAVETVDKCCNASEKFNQQTCSIDSSMKEPIFSKSGCRRSSLEIPYMRYCIQAIFWYLLGGLTAALLIHFLMK